MLILKERPRADPDASRWGIKVLEEAGAIHECEE